MRDKRVVEPPKPLRATREQLATIRRELETIGHGACDVHCKFKGQPAQELVVELGKFFLAAVALAQGVKSDSLSINVGIACAAFFIKTSMDKACAC